MLWFEKTILRVTSEEFGEESDYYEYCKPTMYLGDFMRYNKDIYYSIKTTKSFKNEYIRL